MTSEEQLFRAAMSGVAPLKPANRAELSRPAAAPPSLAQQARRLAALHGVDGLSLELASYYPAHDPLEWQRCGIQQGVVKKLRLGQYPVDARLELVNRAPAVALEELLHFVQQCRSLELRTVLVHHGRGHHDGAAGNQLRSFIAQWLPQIPAVQAFHSCQPRHGGLAATYLLLAKSERAREDNRERQRKGRP